MWRRWCTAGLAAKLAGLLALGRALAFGAEARRVNVHLAPRRAKARDGVVLARGAQGLRIAVLLAPVVVVPIKTVFCTSHCLYSLTH